MYCKCLFQDGKVIVLTEEEIKQSEEVKKEPKKFVNSKALVQELKKEASDAGFSKYSSVMGKYAYGQSKASLALSYIGLVLGFCSLFVGIILSSKVKASSIFGVFASQPIFAIVFLALVALGTGLMFVPTYRGCAHLYGKNIGYFDFVMYVNQKNLDYDLTEHVGKCLQNWEEGNRQLVNVWFALKKPAMFKLSRINFIFGTKILPILTSVGMMFVFFGLGHCPFASKCGLVTLGIGAGIEALTLVLLLCSAFIAYSVKRETFCELKSAFGEEYAKVFMESQKMD
jgi:hypothetical protein